ncbi:MAG TPA: arylsulfatase [Gammaproteobacteria bacterium]|nr:arylsulfatase [Gammaproteobacteria bacterium]
MPAQKPNILFVLADDMGYGDLTYLNTDSQIPTPNIDRIGQEGMYFSDAHSPSALCTPTRYGIITGRYCWRTRIKSGVCWGYSKHLIEPERMTVASLLKSEGYNTACIGKWHLGMDMPTRGGGIIQEAHSVVDQRAYLGDIDWNGQIENGPLALGFDHYHGISASLDMHPYIYIEDNSFVGECTTEQDLLFITRDYRPERYGENSGPAHADFVAEEVLPTITNRTVDFIDGQSQDQDTPFFMCMSLTAPHIPIVPSMPYQGVSDIGAYGDFCMEVDDSIGRVLDALDRNGFAENTLVIFTADNGCAPYIGVEDMNAQGHYPSFIYRGYKSDIYEGGHRIPFLARWPTAISAGSHSDETICLTDLLATCGGILDVPIPTSAGEDSYNILPALLGESLDAPIREATISTAGNGAFSIRQGHWKLELTPSSGGYGNLSAAEAERQNLPPIQLYDLQNDIGETTNVYADHPEIIAGLNALLDRYQSSGRSTPG